MEKLRRKAILAGLLAFAFAVSAASEDGRWLPSLPEQSLGQWYKPQNKRQVWLHTMFSLRRELQATEEYAATGDRVRLAKWAGRLVANYRKIPEMVPEWTDEVDLGLAGRLEQAVAAGDFPETISVVQRLGRTCVSCHRENRALVAARFRAPDFSSVRVTDGEGSERSHADHMELLSLALNRVKIAAEDGRWEGALDADGELERLLGSFSRTCSGCHQDKEPEARILGADSKAVLARLAASIADRQEKDVGRYLGEAAVEICARCHAVHRTLTDLRSYLFRE